ncbi:MAG: phytanoyl-CoA dioxygenase family protein [Planctomycetes bacterium]|nr:phytanoyl-CoA dioxygenase family protein [Planctomycetota bacterium]
MTESFARPHPALTPAQRVSLDVNGYVVIPNTLTSDEVGELMEGIHDLKRELQAAAPGASIRSAKLLGNSPLHVTVSPPIEAIPAVAAYCAHPRLVAMAEELIGGEARICETAAIVNRRDPDTYRDPPTYGFHTGVDIPFGSHIKDGLYHCCFVKTLTNLTDLGPDDGGTVVIAGSHKMDVPLDQLIAAAKEDPRLIHHFVAPAGSTLLLSETLIHGTGQIRSERERTILICGYNARLMPRWDFSPWSQDFLDRIPEAYRTLFNGKQNWTRGPRYRTLDQPADTREYPRYDWKSLMEAAAVNV